MQIPDGYVFIYHPEKDGIRVEERKLTLCGNCRNGEEDENGEIICKIDGSGGWMPGDFCSQGEPKEDLIQKLENLKKQNADNEYDFGMNYGLVLAQKVIENDRKTE